MKHIILYHRASTIHTDEQIQDTIASLASEDDLDKEVEIIWERADDILYQNKLGEIVSRARKKEVSVIKSYSLHTLVNAPYVRAMEQLREIVALDVRVSFFHSTAEEVFQAVFIEDEFQQARLLERNQLSAYRMKENGTLVGRRPKTIDIDKATTLRMEGKSYAEIAANLECSAMHIYRSMPLHLRGCLTDRTKKRMRKLQERIEMKMREMKNDEESAKKIDPNVI